MRIGDFMSPDPCCVTPDTPIQEVARLLVQQRINGVPVIDDQGRLVGIVTSGDLTHRLADERIEEREAWWKESYYRSPVRDASNNGPNRTSGRTAGEVMTRKPVTLTPDDDMTVAARMFLEHRVQALPVTEDDRLVGLVSRFDLLRCLADDPDCCNPFRADP
ncbi:CBS domain-containing protein [Thioalkalicoccus limnaeus]|uniref:CBS domain-containing protein n=1 Tax=Thioalkalicoccus limnaeus TaxID=120681 RepID=A0ABV4BEY1_9GAMM